MADKRISFIEQNKRRFVCNAAAETNVTELEKSDNHLGNVAEVDVDATTQGPPLSMPDVKVGYKMNKEPLSRILSKMKSEINSADSVEKICCGISECESVPIRRRHST